MRGCLICRHRSPLQVESLAAGVGLQQSSARIALILKGMHLIKNKLSDDSQKKTMQVTSPFPLALQEVET